MELKRRTIEELKQIMNKDYGTSLSDSKANELGSSLLKITRIAISNIVKVEESKPNTTS